MTVHAKYRAISLFILSLLLIGTTGISRGFPDNVSAWESFRGDSSNRGFADPVPKDLDLIWEFRTDSAVGTTVLAEDDLCIFGTMNGTVYGLDSRNGTIRWSSRIGAPVIATPALVPSGERAIVCDTSGRVTALSVVDGSVIWQWDSGTGREIRSSPTIGPDGKIYFGSYDAHLYALYPNGTLAWRFVGCTGWIHTSPAVYMDRVYFGSCDGQMRCLSTGSGRIIWNFSAAYIPSSPAAVDGSIYFGSYDSTLYRLDADTSALIWKTALPDNVYSSPSIGVDEVVVGCNDGMLYSISRENGSVIWILDLGPLPLEASPVISGDRVFETCSSGLIISYLSNGSVYRRFEYGDSRDVSPSIHRSRVFTGDSQGYVRCIGKTSNSSSPGTGPVKTDDSNGSDLLIPLVIFPILFVLTLGVLLFKRFLRETVK